MNLLVIGLNHRTAPVAVRERLAFSPAQLGTATTQLIDAGTLREAAILSTCNRVEIYGLAAEGVVAGPMVCDFLRAHHQSRTAATASCHRVPVDLPLYEHRGTDTVKHLVTVAAGLDSMVVGETEILGQVKTAYFAAQQAGATGPVLNRLFQKAFAAAKQIRSTTAISRGSVSVGSVAVELAQKIFGNLNTCRVMVLGTGDMSAATARALHSRGAGNLLVCSRTQERAAALAAQLGGNAIAYEDWPRVFGSVDIVISSTAAPHPIVTREKLIPLMKSRHHRPLFLIDIAVPRDVERACGDLDGVYLYDIDDLQQIANQNRACREMELTACRELVERHASRFADWFAGYHGDSRGAIRRSDADASTNNVSTAGDVR